MECMYQHETMFHIVKENFGKALEAIKRMITHPDPDEIWPRGVQFSGIHNETVLACDTLERALVSWRWKPEFNENGDIDYIEFQGERTGDHGRMFEAIAPFVEKGSYIVMERSDSEWWRWFFDGQTLQEQSGHMTFEPNPK